MQATLDSASLKHLTRAILCLSKYGEDLTIYANPQTLSLLAMNSAQSAYCRFKYDRQFFSRYTFGDRSATAHGESEDLSITGQLNTKALLSILKHKTVEKTVEKCELSVADGATIATGTDNDDERDMLESRLIVRLHCKHGVVKTHRLNLASTDSVLAPRVPDTPYQSHISIGAKALKEMIEHFPAAKGPKSDPQLIWRLEDLNVHVKSHETTLDAKGVGQLATELTLSAEEFDDYDVHMIPCTISFHLREFNATIAFAETSTTPLQMRFTDPAEPLFIDLEGDFCETLFVIATTQIPGSAAAAGVRRVQQTRGKKRNLDETTTPPSGPNSQETSNSRGSSTKPPPVNRQKPMKVMEAMDRVSAPRELNTPSESRRVSMGPPSLPIPLSQGRAPPPSTPPQHEPLFLPSSQLSQAAEDAIRESGLGIENMTAAEFEAMFEDDGDEVGGDFEHHADLPEDDADVKMEIDAGDSLDIFEEMEPTQNNGNAKAFKPLFED